MRHSDQQRRRHDRRRTALAAHTRRTMRRSAHPRRCDVRGSRRSRTRAEAHTHAQAAAEREQAAQTRARLRSPWAGSWSATRAYQQAGRAGAAARRARTGGVQSQAHLSRRQPRLDRRPPAAARLPGLPAPEPHAGGIAPGSPPARSAPSERNDRAARGARDRVPLAQGEPRNRDRQRPLASARGRRGIGSGISAPALNRGCSRWMTRSRRCPADSAASLHRAKRRHSLTVHRHSSCRQEREPVPMTPAALDRDGRPLPFAPSGALS